MAMLGRQGLAQARAYRFPLNVDLYSAVGCSVSSVYMGTDALTHSWEHCSVSL